MKISGLTIREWLCVFASAVLMLVVVAVYCILRFLAWLRIPYFKKAVDDIDRVFDDPYDGV